MERSLEIYKVEKGEVIFDIDQKKETVWATQDEIAKLFDVDRTVVSRHLRNIYRDEELEESRTCEKNAQVQDEGGRQVVRQVKKYNLDAIISVGYRVNSKKATKFRVWATNVLKRYVVDGVAVNERRLKELPSKKLEQLEATLSVVQRLMGQTELEEDEAKGILEVISRYGRSAETIKEYDEGHFSLSFKKSGVIRRQLTIGDVRNVVENLREQLNEKGEFGEFVDEAKFEKFLDELSTDEMGKSIAEKATRLLYYTVHSKPFKDGNRQIGALLFIYYLTINDFQLSENGETKISDRALTAIVLLMAESEPSEEELIIELVVKLLA